MARVLVVACIHIHAWEIATRTFDHSGAIVDDQSLDLIISHGSQRRWEGNGVEIGEEEPEFSSFCESLSQRFVHNP